ncbi:hypothetical protein [Streptomyces sp. NPDC001492]
MNESEFPPEHRPVDLYLGLLRTRMDTEDFRQLLGVVEPVLRALEEQRMPSVDFALGEDQGEGLSQEVRDEAALVIAAAVTGRLDNEVVEIDLEGTGPIRVITDADTASDPVRLGEIADYIRERHRQDEELRGIAEVSGLSTDF